MVAGWSGGWWYAATVQVMNHYKLKMKKRAQHTLTRRTATRTTRKRTVTSGLPTTRYRVMILFVI